MKEEIFVNGNGAYAISKNGIRYSLYGSECIGVNATPDLLFIVLDDSDYSEALSQIGSGKTGYFVNWMYGLTDMKRYLVKTNDNFNEYIKDCVITAIVQFEASHPEIVKAIGKTISIEEIEKKLEDTIDEIFLEYQNKFNVESGDLPPFIMCSLETKQNNLANAIYEGLVYQIES